jgi:hypothetical protein
VPGKVTRRTWTGRGPTGRKVKHVAYGFTIKENGKRVRKYDASWSKEDAEKALAPISSASSSAATWDRVDLSRGVLRLEITKNGRRSDERKCLRYLRGVGHAVSRDLQRVGWRSWNPASTPTTSCRLSYARKDKDDEDEGEERHAYRPDPQLPVSVLPQSPRSSRWRLSP